MAESNANQTYIFLDLDGVVADFDAHAVEQGKYTDDGKMKWDDLDYEWWSTMPACEGAKKFYDVVKDMGIVKFLTAPVLSEECFSGKASWVQNFIPERGKGALKDLIICPSGDKHCLARPNHILIDDRIKNVQEWVEAGGVAIHHEGNFKDTIKKLQEALAKPAANSNVPVRKQGGNTPRM